MPPHLDLTLADEAATASLAAAVAGRLHPGDTLLLSGPIGAGKSTFARALIRATTGNPAEDVPSPTFTLVQTYATARGEVWHVDLYRLSGPGEALELGLEEAFDTAICLIEWPDRLGDAAPPAALRLDFGVGPTGHHLRIEAPGDWPDRLAGISGDPHD